MSTRTKKLVWITVAGVLAASASGVMYLRGYQHAHTPAVVEEKAVYTCPMHPNYKSDKPGNCPICGMRLVKVEPKQTRAAVEAAEAAGEAGDAEDAAIYVPPQKQQLIGMRSVPVEVRTLSKEIRTVGRVAIDERRISHVHTKVSGYIEHVYVDFVGEGVKRGQPLFTIYAPDLVAAQQEYLLALKSRDILRDSALSTAASGSQNLVEAARRRLTLWDVSEAEIERLEREGKVKREITIYSPASGIVTERAAYHHGRQVSPEMDLYTIVDLANVWVLADVYEADLPLVRVGQGAVVEIPSAAGTRTLYGRISFISPLMDAKTRTAQARIEFANAGLQLKPEMYTNVVLRAGLGTRLVVPHDAVLDTGTLQYVFLDRGNGYFEPRLVKVAAEVEGFYALAGGVRPGDKVVTAANFLLDSESRLKGAFANMGAPGQAAPVPSAPGQTAPKPPPPVHRH